MTERNKKLKKTGTVRTLVQAGFFALTNGYVQGFASGKIYTGPNKKYCVPGLNCYSCPGALFACPIGSLQATLGSRQFGISCYVFGFLMMVGAFFGRFVCGWLCPFGFIQDIFRKIPFPKKKKNLPGHKYLIKIKYVILLLFVFLLPALIKDSTGLGQPWFCEYICPSGTLFAGMPMLILNPELRTAIGAQFFLKAGILAALLLLSVKYYRPFCKYLCPLGAFYSVFNPISLYHFNVDTAKCTGCGACKNACGMDIDVRKRPNDPECIRCGKCLAVCPDGALTSSFAELKAKVAAKCTLDSSDIPDGKNNSNAAKMVVGIIAAAINAALMILLLVMFAFSVAAEYGSGGATFIGIFRSGLFWIFAGAGILSSFLASIGLAVSINRPSSSVSAVHMQFVSLIILFVGFLLWLIRFEYMSVMLWIPLIPAQLIVTLLMYAAGRKDIRYVKDIKNADKG